MDRPDDHGGHWLNQRMPAWQDMEGRLPALEDRKPLSFSDVQAALHAYPEIARDVARARSESPGSRAAAYLEVIYRRLHRVLYRETGAGFGGLLRVLTSDIPAITYSLRWQIFSVALGFILAAAAGWWLVSSFPELATLFASDSMVDKLEKGELWTDGLLNIVPSSVLSLQIFTNNISVALVTVALGVLYGLGTIYIIGLNGLMLGAVFALTAQYGMAGELFDFVVAHGCVELSVIVVAGAAGFSVGESLARPGRKSRSRAFQEALQRATKLIALCVVFLVGAGLIEGYVSPDPAFSREARIAVGVAYWLVFIAVLCGGRPWRIARPAAGASVTDTRR
jgi:uncharacterized membrane protein SpoIIM required for sporulation